MNKRFFIAVFALATFVATASAQFQPEQGTVSTQVNFSLGNSNTVSVDGLKIRYFLSDRLAVKGILSGSYSSEGSVSEAPIGTGVRSRISTSTFGIGAGVDYFFPIAAAPRLLPYVGAQIGYSGRFYSDNSRTYLDGKEIGYAKYQGIDKSNVQQSYNYLNAALSTGFDFYIYKGLYTGVEFSLAYSARKTGYWERKELVGNVTTTVKKGEGNQKNDAYTSSLRFSAVPTLKLGWCF